MDNVYDVFILKKGQPQSRTTAKHLNQFLGMPWKEAIKKGFLKYEKEDE